jgi:hypothetical protein
VVTPALSVLVLTEDSSASAHDTLVPLARKLLQFVDRHTRSNHVYFEPAEREAALAVRANLWRSWQAPHPTNERSIRILRRTLATRVLEDDVPGYVLFHFDGDCSWSDRGSSENARRLEAFERFVEGLRSIIVEHVAKHRLPLDVAEVDRRLRRICAVVPFYSIESWLYQNTDRARALCQERCGRHVELIGQWQHDRALLDDVVKPKQQLCIGSNENPELAKTLTHRLADELYQLGQSFHATVERLQSCPGLREALRATWADDAHGSSSRSRR